MTSCLRPETRIQTQRRWKNIFRGSWLWSDPRSADTALKMRHFPQIPLTWIYNQTWRSNGALQPWDSISGGSPPLLCNALSCGLDLYHRMLENRWLSLPTTHAFTTPVLSPWSPCLSVSSCDSLNLLNLSIWFMCFFLVLLVFTIKDTVEYNIQERTSK